MGELQGSVQKFSARWFELKPKKLDATKREDMVGIVPSNPKPQPSPSPNPSPNPSPSPNPNPNPNLPLALTPP